MLFVRNDGETEEAFLWRIGQAKDNGAVELSWEDIASIMNKEFRDDVSEYKSEAAYRKPYQQAKRFFESGVFNKLGEDEYIKKINESKWELEKERKKIQTVNLERNRYTREDARDELILENICESIRSLSPLSVPEYIEPSYSNKSYLLTYADCHYGVEFELKDVFGNTINKYSPEIFEDRMWNLLREVVNIIGKEEINELHVFDLGDGIDGIIRLSSQLMKLRYGVIESTIKYAEFISNWLNELSRFTRIKFQMVKDSNHSQLRICSAPKNAFSDENMNHIMITIIKERLKDNHNIEIVENPTGYAYSQMSAYPTLGAHGEFKNKTVINDLSRALNTPISYLIGAHLHHSKSEEFGINCEQLGIRSIIGTDSYGMSLNKTSKAGASLFTFEETRGLIREDKIILN